MLPRRYLPPIPALMALEAVDRLGTASAAAEELSLTQGAIHGKGAALIPPFLIQRDLSDGRLVPAFGPPIPALGSYYLVWPNALPERAPLRSLRLWLQAETADPALTPLAPPATLPPRPEAP